MRNVLGIAPLALLLLAGSAGAAERAKLTVPSPADKLQVGTGVICDTQEEVTRFVKLMEEHDAGVAMQAVNRDTGKPLACGMATVAFRTGKDFGEVRNGHRSFKIMQIEVVAGTADGAWHMLSPQRTQFTAIALEGLDI